MKWTPPAKLEKNLLEMEVNLSSKIPYAYLLDQETIETKSGHLFQVIKLDGLMAETMDDVEIDQEKHIRNSLLKSITDSSIAVYFHTIRKRDRRQLSSQYAQTFAEELNAQWQSKLQEKSFFINELYITVVKKPPTGKIRQLGDIFSSLSSRVNKQARDAYRKKSHSDVNKVTSRIISHLSRYKAYKLSAGTQENTNADIIFSDILSFLAELINLEKRNILAPISDLASYLPFKRLFVDKTQGVLALRNTHNESRYAAILSIKEYDKATASGMLDSLLDLKVEMIITQSFSFLDKSVAKGKIAEQQRNQLQSDDGSLSSHEHINQTLDNLGGSDVSIGEHHLSILCHTQSIPQLEKEVSQIDAAFNELGIIAIREDAGLKAAYFAMLPGNQAYISRRAMITSQNMAGFASLHNYQTGLYTGNHWGEAVTVLETISGTPFFFSFHVLDVANTFLIGSMGSGKTLLEAFLLAQSMKFGGRLIVFDKDRGLEIFVRAMDGAYSLMNPKEGTRFAPFQMEDTKENRYFLVRLLKKMAAMEGNSLNDEELAHIRAAADGAFNLPPKDRVLRNIVPFLGMRKAGSLRARFDQWIQGGDYAWVFDNEVDDLSLRGDVIGFDMSHVLKDSIISQVIYLYLFHRLEQMMDGTKTRIVVAEGWLALQDEEFRKQIQDWSSTPRKKNAFLVLDTQAPQDIAASPIGCKIIQESVTQIYFANPNAQYADYVTRFGLSDKEYQIIRSLNKSARFFLLKQGKNSVVVRADLSGLENEIAILSGRTHHVKLLDGIRTQKGNRYEEWRPDFIEAINKSSEVNA